MTPRSVVTTAIALLLAIAATTTTTEAGKLMCTDDKFASEYSAIQNKMSACQAATGITLELPLPAKKKATLCEKCTELAATADVRGFPKCNVTSEGESITLNLQFVRLFRPIHGVTFAGVDCVACYYFVACCQLSYSGANDAFGACSTRCDSGLNP